MPTSLSPVMTRIPALAAALAAGLLCAAPAFALDLPPRKDGLWELKMVFEGQNQPPQITTQCIDAETDKMLNAMGNQMGGEICSKQDIRKDASGGVVVDAECEIAGMKMTTHSEMRGDFNSAYTVKSTSKSEGRALPMSGADGTMNMTIEAKWAGACLAGQKPGDVMMANGMKMNVRDMQALMKNLPDVMKNMPKNLLENLGAPHQH